MLYYLVQFFTVENSYLFKLENNNFNETKTIKNLLDISQTIYIIHNNVLVNVQSLNDYLILSTSSQGSVSNFLCVNCFSGCFYIQKGSFYLGKSNFKNLNEHSYIIPSIITVEYNVTSLIIMNTNFFGSGKRFNGYVC